MIKDLLIDANVNYVNRYFKYKRDEVGNIYKRKLVPLSFEPILKKD